MNLQLPHIFGFMKGILIHHIDSMEKVKLTLHSGKNFLFLPEGGGSLFKHYSL